MVALCRLVGRPTKNVDKIVFRRTVPRGMVPNHGNFVRVALRALRTGKIVPEI
jgi:hypothetical protein